jgi:exosortase
MDATAPETTIETAERGGIPRDWLVPILLLVAGVGLAFWPLFRWLPSVWFGDDTYYAHGAVVPICCGLLLWDRWPTLKNLPIKPSNLALIPIGLLLFVGWVANRTDMRTFQSIILVLILMAGVWFVAGKKWLLATAIPIGYLAFGLPIFDRIVDTYTLWIQKASTELSFLILKLLQLNPYRLDASSILVDRFPLNIGVACSGMKLLLAVFSITVFFMLIAKLKWWGNVILLSCVIPLALLVNSLRIVLIGVVGSSWGADAGHKFHDYSGYLSLVISFLLLLKLTKVLGWK